MWLGQAGRRVHEGSTYSFRAMKAVVVPTLHHRRTRPTRRCGCLRRLGVSGLPRFGELVRCPTQLDHVLRDRVDLDIFEVVLGKCRHRAEASADLGLDRDLGERFVIERRPEPGLAAGVTPRAMTEK
jgi:hypothetical protein